MKKTKLFFGATTFGALILPLTTAIACGTSAPAKTEALGKPATPTGETGGSEATPTPQPGANSTPTSNPTNPTGQTQQTGTATDTSNPTNPANGTQQTGATNETPNFTNPNDGTIQNGTTNNTSTPTSGSDSKPPSSEAGTGAGTSTAPTQPNNTPGGSDNTSSTPSNTSHSIDPLSLNFKYHGDEVIVADDGIYFASEGLNNATFWSGTKAAGSAVKSDTLIRMTQARSPLSATNISLLGRGDYFYIIYDEDANDIADITRFETSFAILDTASFEGNPIPLVNKNISLGNLANPFFVNGSYRLETTTSMLVTFANGISNPWISSSDVTPTTYDQALAKVKANLSDAEYSEMQSYYRSHSKVFKPVYREAGAFSAERVAKNAIKITFNGFEEEYGLVASGLVLGDFKQVDGIKNRFFNFTFGDKKAWDKYENSQNQYQYFIRRNSYLA